MALVRIFAFLAVAGLATGATFTLEQVLSAPFPSDLVAAPGGGAVAWVLNEHGARNVWYAAAPDFKGVRLTSWTADDGQDIGELHFTPDGRSIVFVRGGDQEFPGKADPNPASNPAGVEQDIDVISASGGAPRKIAVGYSPAVSGGHVAYLTGGHVSIASLDRAEPGTPIHMRSGESASELTWSPDGTRLAFVSTRGSHAFLAVYDPGAKTIVYLDPSVDHDHDPVWSPDGKQIAYIREFQTTDKKTGPHRSSSEPWAILVANVADGSGHQIWRADKGSGSVFRALTTEHQLFWSSDGRVVFPWEKEGWLHLYSMPASGGSATALTPGNFEVENASLSDDGKELLFSSNQNDIDRRHVWRVPVAGGVASAVTSGEGLEWSPVTVSGGVAYLHSDAKRPARAAVRLNATEHDLASETIPRDFPTDLLVAPQQVTYSSADGLSIHGQLFLPAGMRAGEKHPAVIFLHGGSRRQMLLGWHNREYYNHAYAMNQYLANQGYIVLAINYRSGIGYGLNFREALNYGPYGASEFADVEAAGLYLKNRADVDGSRIGLWGGSYGGYLTALGLAKRSDLFKAGVDFHGVHDWNLERPIDGPIPGSPAVEADHENTAHLMFNSSPLNFVKTWKSPVLLIAGDDDRNVAFENTVQLVAALRAQRVDFEQLILPDEIHEFLREASWLKAYHATTDFLKKELQQ